MSIYYQIAKKSGLFTAPHADLSVRNKIEGFINAVINSIWCNPFFAKKVEVVVVPHRRSKEVEGEYIDIYSHYLVRELEETDVPYLELEGNYLGWHIRRREGYKAYTDFIDLASHILKRFVRVNLTREQEKKLDDVSSEVFAKTKIKIDIKRHIVKNTKLFVGRYNLYRKLFLRLSPRDVYLVVSYSSSNPSLIKAAKECGAKVIEIQHGTFSEYHLGYSYPGRKEALEYFPDIFFVWSEFWKKYMGFPVPEENVVVSGFKYLDKQRVKYTNIEKEKDSVVVISQGALGEKIARAVLSNIRYFEGRKIRYKLHPGEYDQWRSYPSLLKLLDILDVELLQECDLYEVFARSEYQAGVFSTAIYEGIEFGCKTILFELPGIEYMKRFIELNEVEIL